jgi:hypothetical protein
MRQALLPCRGKDGYAARRALRDILPGGKKNGGSSCSVFAGECVGFSVKVEGMTQ